MQRNENETIIAYMERATQALSVGDISIKEWAEIVAGDGEVYSPETLRRCSNLFKMFLEQYHTLVKDGAPSEEKENLEQILEEIKKEKIKVQTANLEYNANLRHDARQDMLSEKVVDAIERLKPFEPVVVDCVEAFNAQMDCADEGLLLISDIHAGADFEIVGADGMVINAYNFDIMRARFEYIADWLIKNYDRHANILNIGILGDMVENCLRMSSLAKLKEPVVDTVIKFSEFLAEWLDKLSRELGIFIMVDMISGNHDEIRMLQQKAYNPEENFGKLIAKYVQLRLANNNRVTVHNCVPARISTIAQHNILLEHGTKSAINTYRYFSDVQGMFVEAMYCGHLHSTDIKSLGAFDNSDVKIHRVGSIMGIDPYSNSLRKGSLPSCHLAYYNEQEGETWSRDIYLNKVLG